MGSVFTEGIDKVLSRDIEEIDNVLSVKDEVREETIRITRDILRLSTEAVRMLHLRRYEDARRNIEAASHLVSTLKELLHDHPDLYYSGLVYNSVSEYAEARISYSLIVEKKMPSYQDLNIHYVPYLQGLGDVVGELRRHVIMLLNEEKIDEASEYVEAMETIYLWLRKLNYPDALVPGLRHKVDVARRLIEDTRVLLLNTRNALKVSRTINKILDTDKR
ncbi:MAG: haloacid dehalogenase [Crenarchaeota archaeon]|nr:haloacid dehalogenase [Thermoproteota archaeon]